MDLLPSKLASEIKRLLRQLPSLQTRTVRAMRREYSRRLSAAPPQFVIELALELMDGGSITHRFVAYELVAHHRGALASLGTRDLERFGRGIDSWGAVDMFGCYLAGPAWRQNQVADGLIHRWARSRDRWWRRAALVSTVPLNSRARGGSGDASRTFAICAMLAEDKDDMVVKALSWSLRELAKRDPDSVRRFVDQHRDVLAARVVREVGNKLATGLKNPRKING